MRFMQDGARSHQSRRVFDVLKEHFENRILALGFPDAIDMGLDWPPHSPDSSTCDSFLWRCINDKSRWLASGSETVHVYLGSFSIVWPLVCNASMSETIIDMTESHCLTIDGACLTEVTDASEDGGRIALKKGWRRGGKCPDVRTSFLS
ncbi:uncharacterized protein TNIN_405921 [Trichonephila inaurata madagascariensis]|uniref:Uncharacterized protein n=1 Tax=Trichonephila inaurata madagascariensis TaxID=2747483 RepID=A0A8X7CHY0_9ARAC|nr:uncharacterized protein TNIN_405921 [Trichonephila inaurata madagascariensis]